MHSQDTPAAETGFALEEYRSLRETIQARGSLRIGLAMACWLGWAALALWCWTTAAGPVAGLVPLFVLVAGFEAVLALHAGVERIGRYVQRMFENGGPTPPAWEHIAVAMGPRWLSPGGLDPLFAIVFILAVALNDLVAAAAGGSAPEIAFITAAHSAAVLRIVVARRFAARQRAADIAALESVISSNSLVSRIQQQR